MVGSIDPRCETIRGTHWPKTGRGVVWSSRRGNHLGQRPNTTASTGRTYGCKRSDQTVKKLLWHGGRPHMGPRFRGDDIEITHSRRSAARHDQKHLTQHDPRWCVVAGAFLATHFSVDAGLDQARRQYRAQQKMVQPQSCVARPAVSLVIPEGEHRL
jgi:hypothetical protein